MAEGSSLCTYHEKVWKTGTDVFFAYCSLWGKQLKYRVLQALFKCQKIMGSE
jgi:hypothetical protein